MASASGGSFDAWRLFGAIDTGYIGQSGAKAFVSYSHTNEGNYAGPVTSNRDHIDFKPKIHSSLFVAYSDLYNARIPFISLAQAQNGVFTNSLAQYYYSGTYTPGVTTSYFDAFAVDKKNLYVALNNDIGLSSNITLHITPYFKYVYFFAPGESILNPATVHNGNQLVTAAYDPSQLQGDRLFLQNNTNTSEYQPGVVATLDADLSKSNRFTVGYWHETWRINYRSYYNLLDLGGNSEGTSFSGALRTTAGAVISPSFSRLQPTRISSSSVTRSHSSMTGSRSR